MYSQRNNSGAITQTRVFKTVKNTTQAHWHIKYISLQLPLNFVFPSA